jgi:ribonuclease P protein component
VGFSVSKRVGGSVVRNLVKRRLRESIRRDLSRLAPGWDIVITARPAAANATYDELRGELTRLLTRAKLLTNGAPVETRC